MGYGHYIIDGKECGYLVEAVCEEPDCEVAIDRGLPYACGDEPGESDWWCDGYFCFNHLVRVGCPLRDRFVQACQRCADALGREEVE